MSILTRLIIKEWLRAFFAATFILLMLSVVANVISELLRQVASVDVILKHHLLESFKWLAKILPVATLAAGLFSLNNLQNKNEMTAIFSLGYSRKKFILIILFLASGVGVFQLFNTAVIIPWAKRTEQKWIQRETNHFRENRNKTLTSTLFTNGKIWYKGKDYFSSFSAFDKKRNELRELVFYKINFDSTLKAPITKIIEADRAIHLENDLWILKNVRTTEKLESLTEFPRIKDESSVKLHLSVSPQDFSRIDNNILQLSMKNLFYYIKSMERLGINVNSYKIYFYDQFSQSVTCLIFAFYSMTSLFSPSRRGKSFGLNVFLILVFNIVYWLLHYTGQALGTQGKLSPILGTFLAASVCMLGPIFYYLFKRKPV
jgi:LPS export ABC transporter permease LptG